MYVAIIKTINYIFRRFFKIELLIKTPLDNLKYYLSKKLFTISHGKIMDGAYQSVSFNKQTHWSFADFASKLLGSYELEVQKKICETQKKYNLKNIINIGAGEGYHVISLLKNNYFEKGYAFEINKKGQKIIYDNLILNKIENKVKIFGEGNYHSIKTNINSAEINSSLFLVDIEGGEFSLFDIENINFFKNSFFIIEMHYSKNNSKKKLQEEQFFKLITDNFIVQTIKNLPRHPNNILISSNYSEEFNEDEKFIMMSEHRPGTPIWLFLSPTKYINNL